MDQNKWVVDSLCGELDLVVSKGSVVINAAMVRAYINLLKQQAVYLEEKQQQKMTIEDVAVSQLAAGMKKANMPVGIYHIKGGE